MKLYDGTAIEVSACAFLLNCSIYPVISAGFLGWRGPPNVWGGPIFEGRNEILLLGKALKFRVIFQKYALKLIEIWKTIEKIREKCKVLQKFLIFGRDYWINKEYNKIRL